MTESPESGPSTTTDKATSRLIRRVVAQWPIIVGCALVAGIAGYLVSNSKAKVYSSTTTVQLNDIDLTSVFLAQNLQQQGQDAPTKAATAAKLATMPGVMEAASRELQGRVSPGTLASRITVVPKTDTTLVDITAQAGDPGLAAAEANAVRKAFITIRQTTTAGQLTAARARVGEQLRKLPKSQLETAVGVNLQSRYNQLDTIIATAGAGVSTAQPATPSSQPVSPRPKSAAMLSLILGGILGAGIALLRARLDDRIRDQAELSEHWDLPVLGLIPQSGDLASAGATLPAAASIEAFALTRTNLRYLHVGGDVRTLVVTSAMSGEGKSTVAWNLALATAMAGQRVLLVEADLRRPVLAQRLGIASNRGLSDLLAGLAEREEVVTEVRVPVRGGDDALVDVVPAGFIPPSPIALLERGSTADALKGLAASYDLTIIDTPPATVVADAKVLLSHADGAVVVSRLGRITRSSIDRLSDILRGLDTPVLGTVINSGASAKEYGYASYAADRDVAPSAPNNPSQAKNAARVSA